MPSSFRAVRAAFLPLIAAAFLLPAVRANALEDAELGKYWTPDALHVPYRAVLTEGRRGGEKVPLIVFLHGDWQDGTDNESQLAGDGNGSYELVDTAREGRIPLVYIAPQTTNA